MGKVDHDIVIELVTDVNNIILRLKALNMEEMLHVDNEFLSAIYRVLPNHSKTKWLEFDKSPYKSKWAGFVKFLEVARDQALQNKVLLSCYAPPATPDSSCKKCGVNHGHKKCPSASVNTTNAKPVTPDPNIDKKEREKKARVECGKCPLCRQFHTFSRKKEQMM